MKLHINRMVILIALSALCLSVISVNLSKNIIEKYYKSHSFYYDPITGYSRAIPFYQRMKEEENLNPIASRLNFAKLYFEGDSKVALFYIPAILFAPELLATPFSFLTALFFILGAFLFIQGYSLFLRIPAGFYVHFCYYKLKSNDFRAIHTIESPA